MRLFHTKSTKEDTKNTKFFFVPLCCIFVPLCEIALLGC